MSKYTESIMLLAKEAANYSCPNKSYNWKARGGCARACDAQYSQSISKKCWADWAKEKTASKQEPNDM